MRVLAKKRFPFLCALSGALIFGSSFTSDARAAVLKVSPTAPQPGDVLTLTVYPQSGETITAIGMAAFDTSDVQFFMRSDGTARAFVGFPFNRKAGSVTLSARVRVQKTGQTRAGTPDIRETEQIVSTRIAAKTRYFPTQHISMKSSTAGTMSRTSALRAEKLYVQSKMKNSYPAPLWSGNWSVPSRGRDGSPYGRRRYVNGKWWGQHNGSDIKAPTGTPVTATNSGRVVLSENLPTLRGNCVVIDHGCNVFSIYMHLSQRAVRVGDSVRKGQLIGRVGSTGFSTGPHLHWEIRIGWEPVDPYKIVRGGLNF
jgi:murein DD-endopeptidase MepM/ murein hydrolase activator NlpD